MLDITLEFIRGMLIIRLSGVLDNIKDIIVGNLNIKG
jgi:hypothetical protein